jgi:hypothetical protein
MTAAGGWEHVERSGTFEQASKGRTQPPVPCRNLKTKSPTVSNGPPRNAVSHDRSEREASQLRGGYA